MGIDRAGVFAVEQPLIDALQRKFARTMARRAVAVWIGVVGFAHADMSGRSPALRVVMVISGATVTSEYGVIAQVFSGR